MIFLMSKVVLFLIVVWFKNINSLETNEKCVSCVKSGNCYDETNDLCYTKYSSLHQNQGGCAPLTSRICGILDDISTALSNANHSSIIEKYEGNFDMNINSLLAKFFTHQYDSVQYRSGDLNIKDCGGGEWETQVIKTTFTPIFNGTYEFCLNGDDISLLMLDNGAIACTMDRPSDEQAQETGSWCSGCLTKAMTLQKDSKIPLVIIHGQRYGGCSVNVGVKYTYDGITITLDTISDNYLSTDILLPTPIVAETVKRFRVDAVKEYFVQISWESPNLREIAEQMWFVDGYEIFISTTKDPEPGDFHLEQVTSIQSASITNLKQNLPYTFAVRVKYSSKNNVYKSIYSDFRTLSYHHTVNSATQFFDEAEIPTGYGYVARDFVFNILDQNHVIVSWIEPEIKPPPEYLIRYKISRAIGEEGPKIEKKGNFTHEFIQDSTTAILENLDSVTYTLRAITLYVHRVSGAVIDSMPFYTQLGVELASVRRKHTEVVEINKGCVRELWTSIRGESLKALTSDPRYPSQPTFREVLGGALYDYAIHGEFYGQRIMCFFTPPFTKRYTFKLSANNFGELKVGKDSDSAVLRSAVDSFSIRGSYAEPDSSSSMICNGGEEYYLELLHVQLVADAHLSVRIESDDGLIVLDPIPSRYLTPYFVDLKKQFILQSTSAPTSGDGAVIYKERPQDFFGEVCPYICQEYNWLKDGHCDDECNFESCGWDGGDCYSDSATVNTNSSSVANVTDSHAREGKSGITRCRNRFDDCVIWATVGEDLCSVYSWFMIYHCPGSCSNECRNITTISESQGGNFATLSKPSLTWLNIQSRRVQLHVNHLPSSSDGSYEFQFRNKTDDNWEEFLSKSFDELIHANMVTIAVAPSTAYSIRVRIVLNRLNDNTTSYSEPVEFVTPMKLDQVPATLSDLQLTPEATHIFLEWKSDQQTDVPLGWELHYQFQYSIEENASSSCVNITSEFPFSECEFSTFMMKHYIGNARLSVQWNTAYVIRARGIYMNQENGEIISGDWKHADPLNIAAASRHAIDLTQSMFKFEISPMYLFDEGDGDIDQSYKDSLRELTQRAIDRWEKIVVGDLEDVIFREDAEICGVQFYGNEAIDDTKLIIRIVKNNYNIGNINNNNNNNGGAAASAAASGIHTYICAIRSNQLPIISMIEMTEATLKVLKDSDRLYTMMMHHIGHALGIGTLWNHLGLTLNNPNGGGRYYTGINGVDGFQQIMKSSTTKSGDMSDLPRIHNGHWSENHFSSELMSPLLDSEVISDIKLSKLSTLSLKDLNYDIVTNNIDVTTPATITSGKKISIATMNSYPLDILPYEPVIMDTLGYVSASPSYIKMDFDNIFQEEALELTGLKNLSQNTTGVDDIEPAVSVLQFILICVFAGISAIGISIGIYREMKGRKEEELRQLLSQESNNVTSTFNPLQKFSGNNSASSGMLKSETNTTISVEYGGAHTSNTLYSPSRSVDVGHHSYIAANNTQYDNVANQLNENYNHPRGTLPRGYSPSNNHARGLPNARRTPPGPVPKKYADPTRRSYY